MKAAEFKTGISEVKNSLRGLTLQVVSGLNATPYKTLHAFGTAVVQEEKAGNDLFIKQAWTSNGVVMISTFNELKDLFSTTEVTGIQFESMYSPADFSDYLRTSFGTND